ncbi:hypothetical protein GQ42DRAFT_161321 [Ramicandelaber brevisporus]|nr:hypothetical protein GQ42DRAFT_161321 [Ramicandelaber brevisporus]
MGSFTFLRRYTKHIDLIEKCYATAPAPAPAASSGTNGTNSATAPPPVVHANANELSYLVYYASNKPAKLPKVAKYLDWRIARDAYRQREQDVRITLEIFNALLQNCHSELVFFSLNLLTSLKAVLAMNNIVLRSEAIRTFCLFCKYHVGGSALTINHQLRANYQSVIETLVAPALSGGIHLSQLQQQQQQQQQQQAQGKSQIPREQILQSRMLAMKAVAAIATSPATHNADSRRELRYILPAIFANLGLESAPVLSDPSSLANSTAASSSQLAPPTKAERESYISKEVNVSDASAITIDELQRLSWSILAEIAALTDASATKVLVQSAIAYCDEAELWETDAFVRLASCLMSSVQPQYRYNVMFGAISQLNSTTSTPDAAAKRLCLVHTIAAMLSSNYQLVGVSVLEILHTLIKHFLALLPTSVGALIRSTPLIPADSRSADAEKLRRMSVVSNSSASQHPSGSDIAFETRLALFRAIGGLGYHTYYSDQFTHIIEFIINRLDVATSLVDPALALTSSPQQQSLTVDGVGEVNTAESAARTQRTIRQIALLRCLAVILQRNTIALRNTATLTVVSVTPLRTIAPIIELLLAGPHQRELNIAASDFLMAFMRHNVAELCRRRTIELSGHSASAQTQQQLQPHSTTQTSDILSGHLPQVTHQRAPSSGASGSVEDNAARESFHRYLYETAANAKHTNDIAAFAVLLLLLLRRYREDEVIPVVPILLKLRTLAFAKATQAAAAAASVPGSSPNYTSGGPQALLAAISTATLMYLKEVGELLDIRQLRQHVGKIIASNKATGTSWHGTVESAMHGEMASLAAAWPLVAPKVVDATSPVVDGSAVEISDFITLDEIIADLSSSSRAKAMFSGDLRSRLESEMASVGSPYSGSQRGFGGVRRVRSVKSRIQITGSEGYTGPRPRLNTGTSHTGTNLTVGDRADGGQQYRLASFGRYDVFDDDDAASSTSFAVGVDNLRSALHSFALPMLSPNTQLPSQQVSDEYMDSGDDDGDDDDDEAGASGHVATANGHSKHANGSRTGAAIAVSPLTRASIPSLKVHSRTSRVSLRATTTTTTAATHNNGTAITTTSTAAMMTSSMVVGSPTSAIITTSAANIHNVDDLLNSIQITSPPMQTSGSQTSLGAGGRHPFVMNLALGAGGGGSSTTSLVEAPYRR